jgi:hypothetical protein
VEHVLPQNPRRLDAFSDEEAQSMVYRLGNMTLTHAAANRELGNAPYSTKRRVLEKSGFAISRQLAADNPSWDPERVAAHQRWMADQATAIWRIAQLSGSGAAKR